jgi:hypothetical protein
MHEIKQMEISLVDALVGFTTQVTLLSGAQLAVTRTDVTYDGCRDTYIGYGCPAMAGAADTSEVRLLLILMLTNSSIASWRQHDRRARCSGRVIIVSVIGIVKFQSH